MKRLLLPLAVSAALLGGWAGCVDAPCNNLCDRFEETCTNVATGPVHGWHCVPGKPPEGWDGGLVIVVDDAGDDSDAGDAGGAGVVDRGGS